MRLAGVYALQGLRGEARAAGCARKSHRKTQRLGGWWLWDHGFLHPGAAPGAAGVAGVESKMLNRLNRKH